MNKITSIFTQLNTSLKNNLKKPNKMTTHDLKKRGEVIKTKEGFDYSSNCRIANFEQFVESDTKISIEKYDLTKFLEDLLYQINPNVEFAVSHKSHSTFSVYIRTLKASDFNLDEKYNKYNATYLDLFEFKVKKTNTGFGKCSSYFYDIGTLENIKMISEITIDKTIKEFDINEAVSEYFEYHFKQDNIQLERAIEDEKKFNEKLSSLNISLEDLQKIISLKNSHDYSKQFLNK